MTALSEQAHCPSCGAPLTLGGGEAIVTCPYCGAHSKIVRRLRNVEPEIPPHRPPHDAGNPATAYESWSAEQLVHGIVTEGDPAKRLGLAKALDAWPHARSDNLDLMPIVIETMLGAQPELDRALAGVLGKLICSKDLKARQRIIALGRRYGFRSPGSKGLLFALSLGDAGTVKLLLDIAQWADGSDDAAYAEEALIGVQTAIGRESDRRDVCIRILLHRLIEASKPVQDWIVRFLWCHYDVGYTTLRAKIIDLIDDCAVEATGLVEPLTEAVAKCGSTREPAEYMARLEHLTQLRSDEARLAACRSLQAPPEGLPTQDVDSAIRQLGALLACESFREPVARLLRNYLYYGPGISPAMAVLLEEHEADMPAHLAKTIREKLEGRQ